MIRLKSLLKESNTPLSKHPELINTGIQLANSLISVGFTKIEAAAIVGNMWAESTFNSTAGTLDGNGAFGLIQWRGDRKNALKQYAKLIGKSVSDTQTQIWFLKVELKSGYTSKQSGGKLIPGLAKSITDSPEYEKNMFNRAMSYGPTVQDKALGFAVKSERMGESELAKSKKSRMESAQTIFDKL
jgi:hypothetical protein